MEQVRHEYVGVDEPAPADSAALAEQAAENLRRAVGVLADAPEVVDAVSRSAA